MANLRSIIKGWLIRDDVDQSKQLQIDVSSSATTNTKTILRSAQTANRTILLPDASTTLTGADSADSLTNKISIEVGNLLLSGNTIASTNTNGNIALNPNGTGTIDASSSRIVNVSAPTSANDAVNKTYADAIMLGTEFTDANFFVHNASDVSKTLALDLSGISTGTTRTWVVPDASSTFVGTDVAQAISNKTSIAVDNLLLDGNTISSTNPNGDIIINPSGPTGIAVVQVDATAKLTVNGVPRLAVTGIDANAPSGASGSGIYNETTAAGSGRNIVIFTQNDAVNDSNAPGSIFIEAGNKSNGTGNGGSLVLRAGTSSGGVGGTITVDANFLEVDAPTTTFNSTLDINGATTFETRTIYKQISTPSNPSSGYNEIYPKSDNQFYTLNNNGNESVFGVPIGTVLDFAGSTAPTGYLLCDGSAVSRTTYANLFTTIGTTWGAGNGTTTFNVPDSRGRTSVGAGTGSGLTARTLAATGGEETHALSTAELASHKHRVLGNTGGPALVLGSETDNFLGAQGGGSYTNGLVGNSMENTGSGTAHNNMQPFVVYNKIIKF